MRRDGKGSSNRSLGNRIAGNRGAGAHAAGKADALFPVDGHDHAACVTSAQQRAGQAFADTGLRMTPLRALIFEEVSASHGAIGAYDILDRVGRKGKRLAPISVYRALDALVAAGVVHRLESRNAFFACQQAHTSQRPYLVLVCSGCGHVAEAPAQPVWEAIEQVVSRVGFAFEGSLVEVIGRCGTCTT
jgi:Fur family transcriptional regulator, zinc uptake regulator